MTWWEELDVERGRPRGTGRDVFARLRTGRAVEDALVENQRRKECGLNYALAAVVVEHAARQHHVSSRSAWVYLRMWRAHRVELERVLQKGST